MWSLFSSLAARTAAHHASVPGSASSTFVVELREAAPKDFVVVQDEIADVRHDAGRYPKDGSRKHRRTD
jgi:hypothetical protein